MKNITLEESIEILKAQIETISQYEEVPLEEAGGRILFTPAEAKIAQPPFDRSPLDGYAIKGEDTKGASKEYPVTLTVVEEVCAGDFSQREMQMNEAVRIMTGAPMPKGSNAVIRQEDTDYGEEKVSIYKEVTPWANYCYKGEDFESGEELIAEKTILSAYHIGVLASTGVTKVKVQKKVKVGILSTGDELVEPGKPLGDGKIYNSNLYTLAERLRELGCEPVILGSTGDKVDSTIEIIKENIDDVDIVITTGGVSVGKKDIMHPVVERLPAERLFWRVQIKPGTPILASRYNDKIILSLSGNPSAACITFEVIFREILQKITGCGDKSMKRGEAVLMDDFNKKGGQRRFVRAVHMCGKVFIPTAKHSSGVLTSMMGCNCLIDIEKGSQGLKSGDKVSVWVM